MNDTMPRIELLDLYTTYHTSMQEQLVATLASVPGVSRAICLWSAPFKSMFENRGLIFGGLEENLWK